ncbi:MAG: D-alanyl-D-alanine carboxypeptidase/D-alanyl-D-alanine-endopeptidase [Saprospiraceae bacterium]|nr:D-alanyl-D-alanine carboxypeptidase/D-alanyl-D-alanine-endopeptidase [Saprospiraceae bacterium]HPK09817.1 D-alanyl-D-alanine carboxypeptidase/D-alanyl-D-alanine-endopeptidase [Saprospiraceae bacterium]
MRGFIVLLLWLSVFEIHGQVNNDLTEICNQGILSISVREVSTGEEIFSHQSSKLITPASILKIIPTFESVDILGKEFRFKSELFYEGELSTDGTLAGNLVFQSDGDPTLASKRIDTSDSIQTFFEKFTRLIKNKGIHCIDGNVIISVNPQKIYPQAPGWPANDLGNYYAAGSWSLNVNENEFEIHFDTRKAIGEKPEINSILPNIHGLEIINQLAIDKADTGDQAYIFNGAYSFTKVINGTLPQGHKDFIIRGAIPDPPLFFKQELEKYLNNVNIAFNKIEIVENYIPQSTTEKIKTYESPSLIDIIKLTNTESINLYADAIFNKLAEKLELYNPDKIYQHIFNRHDLLPSHEKYHLEDGSGLSPLNKISTSLLSEYLVDWSKRHPDIGLKSLLPIAGKEGTVTKVFRNYKSPPSVFLKSGSMNMVQSYAGYIVSKKGTIFSIAFCANYCEQTQVDILHTFEKFTNDIYLSK